jgi:hypothetical protein
VIRDPWRADLGSVICCRRRASVFVIRGARSSSWRASASMRDRSAAIRCSMFVIREPWRAGRVRFFLSWSEFFEGGGSKKMAGFVKAGANARFHTLDVLQNSFSSTWNHPTPVEKRAPVDQLVNSCKNFAHMKSNLTL